MKILIGCEYSAMVRVQFEKKGHDVTSCDLLASQIPGKHYQGHLFDIISNEWDLGIFFPPCTDLAVSGAKHFKNKITDGRQQRAIDFFLTIANSPIKRIAIENPVGIMSTHYRKPDQIIQPWQFGDSYHKTTCIWLKNLPLLQSTSIVDKGEFVIHGGKRFPKWYSNRTRERDKTFPGIATAMADQWGNTTFLDY